MPFGEDGKNNDDPGFGTPEFLKALERVRDLHELIPINADDLKIETITQLEQNFMEGRTAYYPIGPWLIKTLKDQNVNFGVTTLPTMDGKQMKTMAGVQNAYVSATRISTGSTAFCTVFGFRKRRSNLFMKRHIM